MQRHALQCTATIFADVPAPIGYRRARTVYGAPEVWTLKQTTMFRFLNLKFVISADMSN